MLLLIVLLHLALLYFLHCNILAPVFSDNILAPVFCTAIFLHLFLHWPPPSSILPTIGLSCKSGEVPSREGRGTWLGTAILRHHCILQGAALAPSCIFAIIIIVVAVAVVIFVVNIIIFIVTGYYKKPPCMWCSQCSKISTGGWDLLFCWLNFTWLQCIQTQPYHIGARGHYRKYLR